MFNLLKRIQNKLENFIDKREYSQKFKETKSAERFRRTLDPGEEVTVLQIEKECVVHSINIWMEVDDFDKLVGRPFFLSDSGWAEYQSISQGIGTSEVSLFLTPTKVAYDSLFESAKIDDGEGGYRIRLRVPDLRVNGFRLRFLNRTNDTNLGISFTCSYSIVGGDNS